MEAISPTAHEDSSGANPSSVKSDDSSPRHEGGRGSPPPNCAICLGTCRNKSFTDSCLHQFCFKCLLTWSKVKAECPLCKQNFRSIIHNVRSNHQYDEYTVEQRHEETVQSIDIDNITSATRRFRYRTTLTLPRRESLAIQQLLLHYPLMAEVFPPPPPATRAPLARRRREPASFRRTVYRHNLWARPLPDFTGRFRDCTPEFYRYNDTQMHRLVPWVSRELHYLLNENVGHISYVLARIIELLPQHHINSPEFREAMQRYLGDRTEHFLHELYCFASTPYDMTGYDRNVQYTTDSRISTMVNEVISSSDSESVDSDIVMVSSSHSTEPPAGPSRPPEPVYPHHYIPPPAPPAPPPPPAAHDHVIIETISQSDTDDDSSEVMVVGYIKPPQDRTPEVVDLLGSDSDVIVQDSAPPAPAAEPGAGPSESEPAAPPRSTQLVKLKLKRQREPSSGDSDSDASAPPPPPRRKRRTRSPRRSLTDSYSPSSSASSDSMPSSDSSESSSTSFSSYERRRRASRRKVKRRTRKDVRPDRRRGNRRRDKSGSSKGESRERRSKRKSFSGKGVKSSKRRGGPASESPERALTPPLPRAPPVPAVRVPSPRRVPAPEPTPPPPSPPPSLPSPGPSGVGRRRVRKPAEDRRPRRASPENKRLRSVVKVMRRNSGDSSPGSTTSNSGSGSIVIPSVSGARGCSGSQSSRPGPARARPAPPTPPAHSDTDPEDNLPLNLSLNASLNTIYQ